MEKVENIVGNDTEVVKKTTKTKTTKAKATAPKVVEKTVDDLRPSDRVAINNLCDWNINFVSEETGKDIVIPASVKNYKTLTLAEIDAQVKIGNIAFVGVDGFGSHAAIRIIDPLIREYVFQEAVDPVQLTEEAVIDMLALENMSDFNATLSELVVTSSEKRMIAIMCSDRTTHPNVNIDNVVSSKIGAIERLSGIKVDY